MVVQDHPQVKLPEGFRRDIRKRAELGSVEEKFVINSEVLVDDDMADDPDVASARAFAWLPRKFRHVCDGGFGNRARY